MNWYNMATMNNQGNLTAVLVVTTAGKGQEYKTDRGRRMAPRYKLQMEKNMEQVEEGIAPLDRLPKDIVDVQIFPHMPNPLVSCGNSQKGTQNNIR